MPKKRKISEIEMSKSTMSHDEKEQVRNIKFDITNGKVPPYGMGVNLAGPRAATFDNQEGKLPPVGGHEYYLEYQIGAARENDPQARGRKRVVVACCPPSGKHPKYSCEAVYYTDDHYVSFVKLE
jgi:guanyl-specific ribonuclease Sa